MLKVKDWVKKYPAKTLADVFVPLKHREDGKVNPQYMPFCMAIGEIPARYGEYYVFSDEPGYMKDAMYARYDLRKQHDGEEIIRMVDIYEEITIDDMALIVSEGEANHISAASKALNKYFFMKGKMVNIRTVLTDEELADVEEDMDDIKREMWVQLRKGSAKKKPQA